MVFPTFQFKSEFGNKEFMIWATVSSQSCFCWLYRAFPFLAAKNMINLISVFTIWQRQWHPTPVFLTGNPRDGGAWWAAVSGVSQSWIWLKQLSISSSGMKTYKTFRTKTQKRCPFHYRGLECKSRTSINTLVTGKFGLGVQNEAGQRLTEVYQRSTEFYHWS